ncbi:hypothetical protein WH240_04980 [Gluconobacter wancherniae]|uniref:hypothetical protein n=1 Tax=Gluconobacter wancherniae TaxID=1307955 RepID=UPI00309ED7E2
MDAIQEVLQEIQKIKDTRKARINAYKEASLATSHRQLFNTLNADIDIKAQGLIGSNKTEYEAMKARKLAEADARDKANKAFWDSL